MRTTECPISTRKFLSIGTDGLRPDVPPQIVIHFLHFAIILPNELSRTPGYLSCTEYICKLFLHVTNCVQLFVSILNKCELNGDGDPGASDGFTVSTLARMAL